MQSAAAILIFMYIYHIYYITCACVYACLMRSAEATRVSFAFSQINTQSHRQPSKQHTTRDTRSPYVTQLSLTHACPAVRCASGNSHSQPDNQPGQQPLATALDL